MSSWRMQQAVQSVSSFKTTSLTGSQDNCFWTFVVKVCIGTLLLYWHIIIQLLFNFALARQLSLRCVLACRYWTLVVKVRIGTLHCQKKVCHIIKARPVNDDWKLDFALCYSTGVNISLEWCYIASPFALLLHQEVILTLSHVNSNSFYFNLLRQDYMEYIKVDRTILGMDGVHQCRQEYMEYIKVDRTMSGRDGIRQGRQDYITYGWSTSRWTGLLWVKCVKIDRNIWSTSRYQGRQEYMEYIKVDRTMWCTSR